MPTPDKLPDTDQQTPVCPDAAGLLKSRIISAFLGPLDFSKLTQNGKSESTGNRPYDGTYISRHTTMGPAPEINGTHEQDDHGSATFKCPPPETFNRLWRGDKQGTVRYLDSIPNFENPYEEREWVKVVLTCIFSLPAY